MKLYLIPWPWDYHRQGAIIVMAENEKAAIVKAQLWFEEEYPEDERGWGRGGCTPYYDKIQECPDGMAFDGGCDC